MILSKPSSWLKRGAVVIAPFAVMGLAAADPETPPVAGQQPMVEELLRRLEKRDALIEDLQRRVKDLERQMATKPEGPPTEQGAGSEPAPVAETEQPMAAHPDESPPAEQEAEPAPVAERAEPTSPMASTADPEEEAPPPEQSAARSAPGQFEVDEDAAERALERTLVVTGALLLPLGKAEIQPSFAFSRSERSAPTFFLADGGRQFVAQQDIRRNTFNGDLFLRFGLPFDSQLELGVPYRYIEQDVVTQVDFSAANERSDSALGFGDFRLGLAKGLLSEGRWWPNLIGRVTWDSDTGGTENGIRLGSGFHQLRGSLTATKRQDPLVFFGSASYGTTFEKNNLALGDDISFSLGTLLAASPETSLRFVLNQTFINELEFNNRSIGGSDRVIGTLNFGASSIIGPGKFLDFTAGFGLTDDAPDYSVGISLAVRFDVPGFF